MRKLGQFYSILRMEMFSLTHYVNGEHGDNNLKNIRRNYG